LKQRTVSEVLSLFLEDFSRRKYQLPGQVLENTYPDLTSSTTPLIFTFRGSNLGLFSPIMSMLRILEGSRILEISSSLRDFEVKGLISTSRRPLNDAPREL